MFVQAVDARRFGLNPDDATAQQQAQFAEQAQAALAQTPGHPAPLEEQVQPPSDVAHSWQPQQSARSGLAILATDAS